MMMNMFFWGQHPFHGLKSGCLLMPNPSWTEKQRSSRCPATPRRETCRVRKACLHREGTWGSQPTAVNNIPEFSPRNCWPSSIINSLFMDGVPAMCRRHIQLSVFIGILWVCSKCPSGNHTWQWKIHITSPCLHDFLIKKPPLSSGFPGAEDSMVRIFSLGEGTSVTGVRFKFGPTEMEMW